MKFDEEVHAEVAANRIVWALGYFVEDQYFVPEGTVTGATGSAAPRASSARAARSRTRASAARNPDDAADGRGVDAAAATRLSDRRSCPACTILMTLINNWDIEGPRNNKVLRATLPDGRVERRFLVADLGATFGRMGGGVITNHSKWNLEHFRQEGFIEKVERRHAAPGARRLRS